MTRLGESAIILRDLGQPAWRLANRITTAKIPGVIEACPAYETVGVYIDPDAFASFDFDQLGEEASLEPGRQHTIPVCYALGEDLEMVASQKGISSHDVIAAHTSTVYECAAIGFCPGFPYLRSLPDAIADVPRRSSPRVRVEPGSVAITGRQTGIYPLVRPGGWSILGRTPLTIVDVADDYFPIEPGDSVRFYSIDQSEFDRRRGERL